MFTPLHASHVMCHMSRVICHVSHVMCLMLCVMCHVSRVRGDVSFALFFDPVAEGLLSMGHTPPIYIFFLNIFFVYALLIKKILNKEIKKKSCSHILALTYV